MSSQDDLGMLWYGVPGVSFTSSDPSEVMLNTGMTAPLLSDHPRSLLNQQIPQSNFGIHHSHGPINFGDISAAQHSQVFFDPQTGDFVNSDYVYDQYDAYGEDSSGSPCLNAAGQHQLVNNQQLNSGDEEGNAQHKTKKPKVHHNPALKLKTPIAYQKDTDIAAIPIMREGMAVCEKCGAIGVKHAFYGKERKYCSLACARPPMQNANLIPKSSLDISKIINKVTSDFKKEANISDAYVDCKNGLLDEMNSSPSINCLLKEEGLENSTVSSDANLTSDAFGKDSTDFKGGANDSENDFISEEPFPGLIVSDQPEEDPLMLDDSTLDHDHHNKIQSAKNSYSWETSYLDFNFVAASVKSFKHCPMSECWDQISTGMKVEVACGSESQMVDSFWVATVIKICGYKALLRFEGFVDNSSKDFWVNLCSDEVHPVGWCATQGYPLIPPKSIQNKYKDWKEFLMRRLTGARTLPTNFHAKISESMKSRFSVGMNLEVVDKNRIAQMRVATVREVIGKRLHLRYQGAPPDDNGFWCHEDAPIIHPVGWSREIGHEIVASQSYHEKCIDVSLRTQDTTSVLFTQCPPTLSVDQSFKEGMKIEAIDPLNLSTICVATIMKVLKQGYLMIRIDSYDYDTTWSDWFCYHSSSTNIFPAGFCERNDIRLTPPKGYEGNFSWTSYLSNTNSVVAPAALFIEENINHGFRSGMSIEAVDLMDPRLVCVAVVEEVKGRLLRIHFDGWEADFDQWVDCSSPDIFPVGWCDLVGYCLEAPHLATPVITARRKSFRSRSRRGRPFGNRRGGIASKTNARAPYPLTGIPFSTVSTKRGRKPRLRGSGLPLQETRGRGVQPALCDWYLNNKDEAVNTEKEVDFVYRGRRGRPRRNYLRALNNGHASRADRRSTVSTSVPGSLQSEDDISDETSSGVASLAGSENSSDPWDADTMAVSEECQDAAAVANHFAPLSLSCSNRTTKNGDSSFLLNVENDHIEDFLTNPGNNVTEERISLTHTSTDDYFVSSFEDSSDMLSLDHRAPSSIRNETCLNPLSPASREGSLNTPTPTTPLPDILRSSQYDSSGSNIMQSSFNLSSQASLPYLMKETSVPFSRDGEITSFSDEQEDTSGIYLPRIIDNSMGTVKGAKIQPKHWSPDDVAVFLRNNDCTAYCENFLRKKVDGNHFIKLTQNEVMVLTGMKVGPSLKIHDLIQQLLAIVNPAQARYQATLLKRGLSFGKS